MTMYYVISMIIRITLYTSEYYWSTTRLQLSYSLAATSQKN
jgi:hypothetical protein